MVKGINPYQNRERYTMTTLTTTMIRNNLNAGTNFAGVEYTTNVPLSAENRKLGFVAQKHTVANVQLFGSVKDFNLYANQVKRNANVAEFIQSDNWFEHTDKFSIVKHKKNNNLYLYAVFNHANSTFTINGKTATREQVAALCTNSVANKLLDKSGVVHNKRNDVSHTIQCRTIGFDNMTKIVLNNQTFTA